MFHIPFQLVNELLGDHDTFTAAYATFLQSGNIPPSLENDIHILEQLPQQPSENTTEVCYRMGRDIMPTCIHLIPFSPPQKQMD